MPRGKSLRNEYINQTFIVGLERALHFKGWTRNKLKQLSGVNLERYKEGDDMRGPSLASAVKIADALEVSLDDLCGRTSYVTQSLDNCNKREYNTGDYLGKLADLLMPLGVDLTQSIILDRGGIALLFPDSTVTRSFQLVFQLRSQMLSVTNKAAKSGLDMELPTSEWCYIHLKRLSDYQKSIQERFEIYSDISFTVGERGRIKHSDKSHNNPASPDSEEASNTSDDGSDDNATE